MSAARQNHHLGSRDGGRCSGERPWQVTKQSVGLDKWQRGEAVDYVGRPLVTAR